jgi:protein transport protein SEC61 subunit gamma and related proteins
MSNQSQFKNFLAECRRVIKVTKKPNKLEFSTIVKVSGLGILVIGAIGFILQMIWTYAGNLR